MNVTGIEWRDLDPQERGRPAKRASRPRPKRVDSEEEDVIEIHGQADDETADGLDQFD